MIFFSSKSFHNPLFLFHGGATNQDCASVYNFTINLFLANLLPLLSAKPVWSKIQPSLVKVKDQPWKKIQRASLLLLLRFVETNPITRGSPSAKLDNDSWHFAQTKVPLNSTAIDAYNLECFSFSLFCKFGVAKRISSLFWIAYKSAVRVVLNPEGPHILRQ